MRRTITVRLFAALLSVVLLAAACGDDDDEESAAGATDTEQDSPTGQPIKVGVVLSESGFAAALGKTERQVIELYVDQVNDDGGVFGRPLQVVFADDESTPDVAVTEVRRLIGQDVVGIVGPSITPTMIAVIPAIKEAGIPALFMTPVEYPNFNQEPLLFSPTIPSVGQNLDVLFPYLRDQGASLIGIVLGNDALGDAFEAAAKASLAKMDGIDGVIRRVPLDSQDYTSVLAELRDRGADAVLAGITGPTSATIRKNQDQLGWDVPFFTPNSNTSESFIEALGDAAEGTAWYALAPSIPDELDEGEQKDLVTELLAAFEERFGSPEDRVAMGIGYDSIHSFVEAVRTAGSDDPAAIRDALEAQELLGVLAKIKRSPDEHRGIVDPATAVYLVQWQDGRFVRLQ